MVESQFIDRAREAGAPEWYLVASQVWDKQSPLVELLLLPAYGAATFVVVLWCYFKVWRST